MQDKAPHSSDDERRGAAARGGEERRRWHALRVGEAIEAQHSSEAGLASSDAAERLSRLGPNRLPQTAGTSPLVRFALQFHNLLIYVLLASAAVSLLLDHTIDAAVIMVVVLINAIIGFVQEGRAERALGAFRGMIDPHASVLRDGQRKTVPADEIVPGDIVLIEAGDRVPADLRLLRSRWR